MTSVAARDPRGDEPQGLVLVGARIAGLLGLYLVAGLLGFRFSAGDVPLLWPPAAVALAGVYLLGVSYAPIVLVGALFLSLFEDHTWLVNIVIAVGSTLGAVAGSQLLKRASGFRPRMDRVEAVVVFAALGVGLSALVNATVAETALSWLQGPAPVVTDAIGQWAGRWLGEGAGILAFAPLMLAIAADPTRHGWPRAWPVEASVLLVLTVVITDTVFRDQLQLGLTQVALLLPFLLLVWGAFRFGLHGATSVIAVVLTIAALRTANGSGLFAEVQGQYWAFWAYAITLGLIGLLIWALIGGHRGSLANFQAVFDASSDGMIIVRDDAVIDCNPAAVDLFSAKSRSRLLATPFPEFSPPKQEDGVPSALAIKHHMREADENGMARFEWLHARLDGRRFPAEIALSPVLADGRPGYLGIVRDITERKAYENTLTDNLRRTTHVKERMESELNVGRSIQMSMLPLDFPVRDDLTLFATLEPAREVGGDFYDFFFIDEHRFCFCVGDVSGKGVPAALFMAVTKTHIKSRAANELSPATILTSVNEELARDNDSAMFVTLWVGMLDLRSGRLTYTNAGHNPPYLKRVGGTLERLDARHGPVVGAVEELAYGEDFVDLGAGDTVLLYTDGVTEAMDPSGELYEEERLVRVLSTPGLDDVETLVRATAEDVWRFQDTAEQADDVTVLAARYNGKAGMDR